MKMRPALLLLALAASSLAWGAAPDEPERIARLSYAEGPVTFQGDAESPNSALPDRPLRPGDRLATGRGGRSELALGTATIRLDEDTELSVIDLEAAAFRAEFSAGTAIVHLRELVEGESFELVTPNATIALQTAGEYRVDVMSDDVTAFTVRHGVAEVATAGGPVRIAAGQRVRLQGRDVVVQLTTPLPADAFEDWVLEREVQLAQDELPALDPPLDDYGEWHEEPDYGRVWMPSYAYGGYDPFRYGQWQQVGFGWSWYGSMPWSAHTFHSGRWAYLDHLNRWCWVPSRRDHRYDVAHDTRPYRQPVNDDRPRDPNPRHDNDERQPAATSAALPLRLGADRPIAFGRATQTAKPARGQTPAATPTYAPAPAQAPRANGNPSPSPQSAPAASSGGTTTMRPAQPAKAARSAAPSTSVNSNRSREFGTIQPP